MKIVSSAHAPGAFLQGLSNALFLGMHAAVLLVLFVPVSWPLVGLAVSSYLLRMWAITGGYHRYFSHRSFKTSRAFQFALGWLGATSMQNGPLWWASWHRHHHKHSDGPLDAHSPTQRGFWYAHLGWIFDRRVGPPDLSNVKDLTRYPELRFIDRHKWLPMISYIGVCFLLGGAAGIVWGFVVSTVVLFHATAFINSLAHVWGKRRYTTPDTSRNNGFLAVLTLGEGWHNNHHHAMSAARQGFLWWEIDVTYYVLKVLSWAGVIWDLRAPADVVLEGPRCRSSSSVPSTESVRNSRRTGCARSGRKSSMIIGRIALSSKLP